jgi:MFS family permease
MSKRHTWIMLIALFVAAVAAPLNQYKVPPVMPVLMEVFALDLTSANLLMSVFSLAGLVLAIPAGLIVQRIGPKRSGLIALSSVIMGSALGALSSGAAMLLASRAIEGLSFVLMMVVAPAIIAVWFTAEERGVPMGIFAVWVPAGSMIMLNLAPVLAVRFGWQSVWWFGCAYGVVGFLLFWGLVKIPRRGSGDPDTASPGSEMRTAGPPSMATLARALVNRDVWLLGLIFFCFTMCFPGFMTNMPTFLHTVRGYPLTTAGFIVSLASLVNFVSCPAAGWISDRIGSRKLVYTVAYLVLTVLWFFPFRLTGAGIPMFMILFGVFGATIPTMVMASIPEIMERPELAGIGMGGVVALQNVGLLLGPVMFGRIVQMTGNWQLAGYALIPFCLLGLLFGLMVRVR